jgi:Ca2+-binding RTX toxin-like protein
MSTRDGRRNQRLWRPLALLALACSLLLAPASEAAFPGKNGKIAFSNPVPGGSLEIFTVNPDGSGTAMLTANSVVDTAPAWDADGRRIAFVREAAGLREIWVMNADGTGQTRLTSGETDATPAFFPDGRIVFARFNANQNFDLWTMNGDGSAAAQLTFASSDDLDPVVSPSGATIAYVVQTAIDVYHVNTMSSGGSAPTPLVSPVNPNFGETGPNFAPDGSRLVFGYCGSPPDDCTSAIAGAAAAGGAATVITGKTGAMFPAYSPDGTLVVYSRPTGPVTPDELALVAPTGGPNQVFVTGFDPDWQPIPERCRGERATIVGTPKGDTIVGTPGNDVIKGHKGRDTIKGKGGDDLICGQRGKDKLFGERGSDIVIGGDQSDYVDGGPGKDRLFGGTPEAPDKEANNVCVVRPADRERNCQDVRSP